MKSIGLEKLSSAHSRSRSAAQPIAVEYQSAAPATICRIYKAKNSDDNPSLGSLSRSINRAAVAIGGTTPCPSTPPPNLW